MRRQTDTFEMVAPVSIPESSTNAAGSSGPRPPISRATQLSSRCCRPSSRPRRARRWPRPRHRFALTGPNDRYVGVVDVGANGVMQNGCPAGSSSTRQRGSGCGSANCAPSAIAWSVGPSTSSSGGPGLEGGVPRIVDVGQRRPRPLHSPDRTRVTMTDRDGDRPGSAPRWRVRASDEVPMSGPFVVLAVVSPLRTRPA